MKTFTFKSEYSDFQIEYLYRHGFPGVFGGPPDSWQPPEPDEIEIKTFRAGGVLYISDSKECGVLDDVLYEVLDEICYRDFVQNHARDFAE